MAITEIIDGMVDLVQKNLISKTNVVSDALTGNVLVNVENSFHYNSGEEIIIIDYGYYDRSSPHYGIYEYAVVRAVNNTHWITLSSPIQDPSGGWLTSNGAFIQKTIGHSPLYDDRVYYGDREVIPTEDMAITVEPVSLSNEWIYLHGGLSQEYKVSIVVYGKDVETEEGMKILNKYTDSVYQLFNKNVHLDINNHEAPLWANVSAGSTTVVIKETSENIEYFRTSINIPDDEVYELQDNKGIEIDLFCTSVSIPGDGYMYIELNRNDPIIEPNAPILRSYSVDEYAVLRRHGRYIYDSRVDGIEYGVVQKGSAFIRAAKLSWFGKEVQEYNFPQKSLGNDYFPEVSDPIEISTSSESLSSSSSSEEHSNSSSSSSFL